MVSGIDEPGRACSQNFAAGVLAADWPCTMAALAATTIRRSLDGSMLRYCYVSNSSGVIKQEERREPLLLLL